MQPWSDVLISTYGFLLEPVAWQMSTTPPCSKNMHSAGTMSADTAFDRAAFSWGSAQEQSTAKTTQMRVDRSMRLPPSFKRAADCRSARNRIVATNITLRTPPQQRTAQGDADAR